MNFWFYAYVFVISLFIGASINSLYKQGKEDNKAVRLAEIRANTEDLRSNIKRLELENMRLRCKQSSPQSAYRARLDLVDGGFLRRKEKE